MAKEFIAYSSTRMRIAVVFHCYYSDLAATIINKFTEFPFEFDLYITTPEDRIASALEHEMDAIVQISKCEIAITPNIGRNFGPFLNEYSNALRGYDLMCHVHTKKSEHSIGFTGWGMYLVDNIIGNPNLIKKVVRFFQLNSQCGLVYPLRFAEVPSWAQHWLGNFGVCKNWCQSNNISVSPGFLEFPTGGMFWVRPVAIDQLLSYNWTYNDFPVEAGQIDGTMHHAIERLIGAITSQNGYLLFGLDPVKSNFHQLR